MRTDKNRHRQKNLKMSEYMATIPKIDLVDKFS